jgi:hypothetical protein
MEPSLNRIYDGLNSVPAPDRQWLIYSVAPVPTYPGFFVEYPAVEPAAASASNASCVSDTSPKTSQLDICVVADLGRGTLDRSHPKKNKK